MRADSVGKRHASERAAWQLLRNRRCHGLKFRRQQPVGGYIVDFYCAELRLALEIYGPVHWESENQFAYDLERTENLSQHATERRSGIACFLQRTAD